MDPGYSVGQRAILKPSDLGAPAHRHHCRRNRLCFFVGCRISVNLGREHSSMQASDDLSICNRDRSQVALTGPSSTGSLP